MIITVTRDLEKYFWDRVEIGDSDQCWGWLGTVDNRSRVRENLRPIAFFRGQSISAHILSWRLKRGYLPQTEAPKLIFRNLCGDTLCVNPDHWKPITTASDVFWLYVVKGESPDDCWQWTGHTESTRLGYGRFKFNLTQYRAHRFSYELHYGPVPEGLMVLHSCHNPACTNPRHLRAGTQMDNTLDRILAGRSATGDRIAQKGSKHWKSILNEDQVRQIRQNPWNESRKALAARFGVTVHTIHNIFSGRQWKHI